MRGFFLSSATNVFNFLIGTILQWSTLGYCNLNKYENEELAFIGQRSGEPLKWRQFDEISKIKYTALFQNVMKLGWNILLAIYHYVKVQQVDDIFKTPWLKANKTEKYGWNRVIVGGGVSEIKCIIFKENNDNPYENYNNYIKLSIVFHPMIMIFFGKKNI
jgi:hypothetical protein